MQTPHYGWSTILGTVAILFLIGMGDCLFALTDALHGSGVKAPCACEEDHLVKEFLKAAGVSATTPLKRPNDLSALRRSLLESRTTSSRNEN